MKFPQIRPRWEDLTNRLWKYGPLVWENKLLCLATILWAERSLLSTKAGEAQATQKLQSAAKSLKIDIFNSLHNYYSFKWNFLPSLDVLNEWVSYLIILRKL